MLDDFFIRALIAGVGLAIIAGPLGCFIIWRKMAYFGETMAHAGLLGIALAISFNISIVASVFAIGLVISLSLIYLQSANTLSNDSLLGIISHTTLAIGLIIISFMSGLNIDLMSFLFGDILSVSINDIWVIYLGGSFILTVLYIYWRALLTATISPDLAQAEGLKPDKANLVFTLLIAGVIAMAMKVIGIILVTSLLIIPAAAARKFASTPEQMAWLATSIGIIAMLLGLFGSLEFDTPSGPSIIVAAFGLFIISLLPLSKIWHKLAKKRREA